MSMDVPRSYCMANIKRSTDIDRVTRAPVHQVDEAGPFFHAHATSMLPFNKVGQNTPFELLSNLERAGFVLPDMPPDFEYYFFIARFVQSHRPKRKLRTYAAFASSCTFAIRVTPSLSR
jgi:predicted transcriptional regulator